jgi:histidinol dehydrogenase
MYKFFISKSSLVNSTTPNQDWYKFIKNSHQDIQSNLESVEQIIELVKIKQDEAIIDLTNKFDKTSAKTIQDLEISSQEIQDSEKNLDEALINAINISFDRIKSYHQKQLPKDFIYQDNTKTTLGNIWRPIDKIGVYVPGGTASYPSSVLMSCIPAIVAGVKNITIFAPSNAGKINPATLYCAKICGVEKIYKIGGAQAIAAMAYGTSTIDAVDKIVGPGNSFVALAKKSLYGKVGIDMIAGPTDITIIADDSANPEWVAIDALSQLEHGIDSKAFIICDNQKFADKIQHFVNIHYPKLSRHKIIEESLKNSAIFIIDDINHAHILANMIAPEHLEICTNNPLQHLSKINNAGAVFLGNYSPEAIGDYMAGPSHTLPTSGTAKFQSGLSVYDFLKRLSLISCTKESFDQLKVATSIFANCEGLSAHQLSIDIRK